MLSMSRPPWRPVARALTVLTLAAVGTVPAVGTGPAVSTEPAVPAVTAAATSRGGDGPGVWPLAPRPRVAARFAPPTERWARGHRGVDLAGAPAQPVVSALAGEVAFAGSIAGRGVVVVSHGPTRTTYEPVLADVVAGQAVGPGTRLGWLHTTGSHCAPAACLHWGWRRGDVYLDPLTLVGGAGVRLLPLWTLPGPLPLPPQARGWAWE